LLETIDFKDKKLVKSTLGRYEKHSPDNRSKSLGRKAAKNDIETAITIIWALKDKGGRKDDE
jgi:hypothetical protein